MIESSLNRAIVILLALGGASLTLYAKFGYTIFIICSFVFFALAILLFLKNDNPNILKRIKKIISFLIYTLVLIIVFTSTYVIINTKIIFLGLTINSIIITIFVVFGWIFVWEVLIKYFFQKSFIKRIIHPKVQFFYGWDASRQINVGQGVDSREIPLKGKLIKSINFSIKPNSQYWRAGIKLSDPNLSGDLSLLSQDSVLIHLGGQPDEKSIGIYVYNNSERLKGELIKGIKNELQQKINCYLEINENNHLKFIVNNLTVFNKRFDSNIRKRVFLLAWGDSYDYEMNFSNITLNKLVYEISLWDGLWDVSLFNLSFSDKEF